MGETLLVESQIAESVPLLRQLDANGVEITFAVWCYFENVEDWKLLLAGPTFDSLLPKSVTAAYRYIAEAINQLDIASLLMSKIKVIETNSALRKAINTLARTDAAAFSRAHFVNTTLNGIFIKEMIVMRNA